MRHLAKSLVIVLAALAASPLPAQSLWNPRRPAPSIFTDTTARNVGDILTVVVDEAQSLANDEKTDLKKESSLSAILSNFNILPAFFETLPEVEGTSNRTFKGDAKYDKDNSFRTTISVSVIDRLPNGNLVIEGARKIMVDGETKTIRLGGIVRVFDVSQQNTVLSSQIAEARVSYEGQGFLNRTTNRGWFSRLLDIVWPF